MGKPPFPMVFLWFSTTKKPHPQLHCIAPRIEPRGSTLRLSRCPGTVLRRRTGLLFAGFHLFETFGKTRLLG